MARGAARFPLPQEKCLWPACGGVCSSHRQALSISHLTWRWRASLQANFRGAAASACLQCSAAGQPRAPPARGRAGKRAMGRWVLGKCMAYQVPGRGRIGQWGRQSVWLPCHHPGHLGAITDRSSCPTCFAGVEASGEQAARLGRSPSAQEEKPERSQLPCRTWRCPSPRLCPQDPLDQAWPAQPPGPSLLAPKAAGGWSSAGWQASVPQPPR